jgi:cyclic pyranopterin phosphate synthase
MYDRYGRNINYLRISVTDRCNLRCRYCMPEDGGARVEESDLLSFGEIVSFTRVAVAKGIDKVRITGGEPLARKGIAQLVRRLAGIPGIRDLSLTTNGILLPALAGALKEAGLRRVNISLDTMDPERYREITRCGELEKALGGIDAAETAGLLPIKINCVVDQSSEEPDARAVRSFCERRRFDVRFIRRMDLEAGKYAVVEGGSGGDCTMCNKLRLSGDGQLRPCLFDDLAFSIRELGADAAIERAVAAKPEFGTRCGGYTFNRIGG